MAVAATAPGPDMVERRGPGRPRANGVSRHPPRTPSARPAGRAPRRPRAVSTWARPTAPARRPGAGMRAGRPAGPLPFLWPAGEWRPQPLRHDPGRIRPQESLCLYGISTRDPAAPAGAAFPGVRGLPGPRRVGVSRLPGQKGPGSVSGGSPPPCLLTPRSGPTPGDARPQRPGLPCQPAHPIPFATEGPPYMCWQWALLLLAPHPHPQIPRRVLPPAASPKAQGGC